MGEGYICLSHPLHIFGALLPPPRNLLVAMEALCFVGNELFKQSFERLIFRVRPCLGLGVLRIAHVSKVFMHYTTRSLTYTFPDLFLYPPLVRCGPFGAFCRGVTCGIVFASYFGGSHHPRCL